MAHRRLLVFLAAALSLWTLIQGYIASRLGLGLAASLPLALLPLGAMFAGRAGRLPFQAMLEWIGFTAMGLSTLLFIYLLAADILLLRTWVDPFWVTAGVLAIAGVSTAGGLFQARRPSVVKVEVPIAHLHGDLERFRIVQLSDLHVGPTLRRSFVERVVDTANGLAPDLVVLTGDVADGMPHQVRHDVAPLARLTAPQGKFFVTGNHEYYWDAPGWVREVEQLGFQALINSHRVIEEGGATMIVAGVTDRSTGGVTPGHRHDTGAALAGAPVANVKLLLAHQPTSAYEAQRAGFDLQLSGHTHGGQYFPFSLLVRLFQPFVAGLHRLEQMWLYVSRGTGYWGPPLRLGAPAEITLIELVRA